MHCQRCRLPVSVHKSLSNLRSNLLFKSAPVTSEATVFGGPAVGFNTPQTNPLSTPPNERPEELLDYISAKTGIDLPLCQECAEKVRDGLKREYEEVCQERDAYINLVNKIKNEPVAGASEVEQLLHNIELLEKECSVGFEELKQAELDNAEAQKELDKARKNASTDVLNSAYSKRNSLESELQVNAVETRRLEALSEYQQQQLRQLHKTNVYNDVFKIKFDGCFGTINGLRLGRLKDKDKKVDWTEINAAWGQTLLLLSTIIAKLELKIPEYRLRPLGSMSRIEKVELNPQTGEVIMSTTLDLFSSGDYSFERLLYHKRLDAAMVAFLDVLKKVGEHVEALDPTLKLPYAIVDDKIGSCSIRLSLNSSNETWTQACKYVLTNAKWILSYACERNP